MHSFRGMCVCFFVLGAVVFAGSRMAGGHPSEQMGSLPLYFERNAGQASSEVAYIARTGGRTVLISAAHAQVLTPGDGLRFTFEGANAAAQTTALEPLRTKVNYLIGPNRSQWRTKLSTWGQLRIEHLYPGIDLVYHGAGAQLEYDFAVPPGQTPPSSSYVSRDLDEFS
jgi:hypothetical protein